MANADPILDLAFKRHADDLRASWQFRLFRISYEAQPRGAAPRDKVGMCVSSILHRSYDDAMPVLLALFGARGWLTPLLSSNAKIAKTGHVMADMVAKDGTKYRNQAIFRNEREMERAFRKLADAARLSDAERIEFFDAIKRWVVCDYRLDPTMNSADPDAKRLAVH